MEATGARGSMAEPPTVRALAQQRADARSAGDFARADALRDEIAAVGFVVTDTPDGFKLHPIPAPARIGVHLLYEGSLDDLERFLVALVLHHDLSDVETVVVDPASSDADAVAKLADATPGARAIRLDRDPGWAAARNVGLRAATGAIVVLADLSIEPTGDVLTPLAGALESDPTVAVTGPTGIVTADLRTWREAATSDCDAIEAYLLACRRDDLRDSGLLNERFTWYRNADLDLSLQLRDRGRAGREDGAPGKARIIEVPFRKHLHRGYARFLDEAERDRQSRRNYNRFLDRWRDRTDLLTGAPARG